MIVFICVVLLVVLECYVWYISVCRIVVLLCCVAVLYLVCQYTRSSCVIICRCLLPSHLSFSFSLPLTSPSSSPSPFLSLSPSPSPRPARRFSHKVRAAGGVKVIVSIMDLYEDDAGVLAVGSDALSGLCSKVRYIPLTC